MLSPYYYQLVVITCINVDYGTEPEFGDRICRAACLWDTRRLWVLVHILQEY